jgi:glycine/serine hydroxymethyltransferase
MERVGTLIVRALRGRDDSSLMGELSREVHDICARFPAPGLPAA